MNYITRMQGRNVLFYSVRNEKLAFISLIAVMKRMHTSYSALNINTSAHKYLVAFYSFTLLYLTLVFKRRSETWRIFDDCEEISYTFTDRVAFLFVNLMCILIITQCIYQST